MGSPLGPAPFGVENRVGRDTNLSGHGRGWQNFFHGARIFSRLNCLIKYERTESHSTLPETPRPRWVRIADGPE